jgi:ubiquinone/menaquinone biosynthesis C-methylase UbiE
MNYIKKLLGINENEIVRQSWLIDILFNVPAGHKILDAGAGELKNAPLCNHLEYVSQDACQYEGMGDKKGLQAGEWDTSKIDIICDIADIPEPDESFDVILCSEVLEHIPEPSKALDEFYRLLKPNGVLIITAPFSSLVHFAPFYYSTGFSRYWYEHHLPERGFEIESIEPNGDWYSLIKQEVIRFPGLSRKNDSWIWPLSYLAVMPLLLYLLLRRKSQKTSDLACLGWFCKAKKVM